MPDVRLPDGTIVRNVPEGTTKAQLMSRLGKAKSTGALGWISDNVLSPLNEAIIGAPEGIYNAASAITDPLAEKAMNLISPGSGTRAVQDANRQRKAVSDAATRAFVSRRNPAARTAGQIGGSFAIPLPGKKLQEGGNIARTAYRAMQGAVGGAAVRDVDQDATAPAAIGAATNVVLPPTLRWLAGTRPAQALASGAGKTAGPVVNWLGAKADDLADAILPPKPPPYPSLPPAAVAARQTPARALAPLGRKAEARAARFKAAGVDEPTTGMVTRDPNSFAFERNTAPIQEVGEELGQQIRNVEMSLVKKGRELVGAQGGSKGAEATGEAVQKALDSKRGEMQRVTGRLYDKVREERGDEVVGTLDSLRDLMADPDMTDNATFDGMRDSLSRRLSRLGLIDDVGAPSGAPGATVKQAEELRKFIRELGSTADPAVRMMRSKLIDALDDDVVTSVGDDAFKAARASAKARFDEFSKTFAGRIADEGVSPERLTKRVLSETTSLSDLRAMRKSLLSGTDEQMARGQEAWKGLRAQALDDFLKRSMNEEGKVLGGQMAREFTNQSAKFRELLDPADYKELRRLVLASRDATVAPPGSAVNYSGTGPMLANLFQSAKPKVREGWLKFMAKHLAAGAVSFPAGNVAVEVGTRAAASAAQQRAAQALYRRVEMARSPEATAKAIQQLKQAAKANPAAQSLLDKVTGPAAAAATNE